jgi:hypothetical protein
LPGEYVEWITEAKREETGQAPGTGRRVDGEGKRRNWKYENC